MQPPYHLFRRDIEAELLPYAREHDIGVLVYGPLAHGLLTGAMKRERGSNRTTGEAAARCSTVSSYERNLPRSRSSSSFAEDRGHTVSQLAVAWTLAHPAVHVAIVGSRSPSTSRRAWARRKFASTPSALGEIDAIMAGAVPVGGPSPEGGV